MGGRGAGCRRAVRQATIGRAAGNCRLSLRATGSYSTPPGRRAALRNSPASRVVVSSGSVMRSHIAPNSSALSGKCQVCNLPAIGKCRRVRLLAAQARSAAMQPHFRTTTTRVLTFTGALAIAACGQSQQGGGFQGFPPAEVTTIVVEAKAIPATYEYVGQTAGSKEVEVRARVTGILEQKLFQEGAAVKAGQVLFVIDPKPLEAQAAALEAELARAQAQKTQADREVGAARAARGTARDRQEGGRRCALRRRARGGRGEGRASAARGSSSSISATRESSRRSRGCRAARRNPRAASSTANETLLTTISQANPDLDPVRGFGERAARAQPRGRRGPARRCPKDNAFDVTVKLADGTTLPRKGRINFADTRINPSTGTIEMRAEIANADGALKPGQFVRVKLSGRRAQPRARRAADRGAGRAAGQVRLRRRARTRTARTSPACVR